MSFEFSSYDYRPTTRDGRISKCRAMAEEATMMAYWGGKPETREAYLLMASMWTDLADHRRNRA
jgi:hypothetical protein